MTDGVWIAAFWLLALLGVVNAVLLVATMRQVGVMHQRLAPTGAGDIGGAQIGDRLPRLALEAVNGGGVASLDAPMVLLAFVSPGCNLCSEIIPGVHSAARARRSDGIEFVFATDATQALASTYAAEHDLKLPLLRHDEVISELNVPGSPYILAMRPEGDNFFRVLAGGVVNTTEQVDDVVDLAVANQNAFNMQFAGDLEHAPAAVVSTSGDAGPTGG